MAITATPDVEELLFKLDGLPPDITAEQLRSHVVRAGWRTGRGADRHARPHGLADRHAACSVRARVQGTYGRSPSA
jgi:hypothetical protein